MTAAVVLGLAFGAAVLLFARAAFPPRQDLAVTLGRWEVARRHAGRARSDNPTYRDRIGLWVSDEFAKRGTEFPRQRTDLAITGKTLEEHISGMVVTAIVGFFAPTLLSVFARAIGLNFGFVIPVVVGLLIAGLTIIGANAQLRTEADEKRDELRRALGTYLDLVSMSLAGGRGVPEALPTSAAIGTGWAFELIGDTINNARRIGDTPWKALGDLGERVGLQELKDLSAALSLVGDSGAKIRASLQARSATLRRRELADAATDASNASESMGVANILLAFGFLALIGYPAAAIILST